MVNGDKAGFLRGKSLGCGAPLPACNVVQSATVDFNGGKGGRCLLEWTLEVCEGGLELSPARFKGAHRQNFARAVISRGGSAENGGCRISLGKIMEIFGEAGGWPEKDE